jgi:hypothetical protein
MHQQLWGYKDEEKLYLGVREQKRLNTTTVYYPLEGYVITLSMTRQHCIFHIIMFLGQ